MKMDHDMSGKLIEEDEDMILLTHCVRCSRHCRLKLWLNTEKQLGHSCARGAVYGHRFRRLWRERAEQAKGGGSA